MKLKNLENLIGEQARLPAKRGKDIAECELFYMAKGWKKWSSEGDARCKRVCAAMYLGEVQFVPVYQYVCHAGSLDPDAVELHENYKQRSTSEFCDETDQYKTCFNWRAKKQNQQSETWIEQEKEHTIYGGTPTDDFLANDILLWQLSFLQIRTGGVRQAHRGSVKSNQPARGGRLEKKGGKNLNFKVKLGYFIKGSIFEINEKIAEFGISRTDQPGLCFIERIQTAGGSGIINKKVWSVPDTGVSLYSIGQGTDRKDDHTGKFGGIYCEITLRLNQPGKGVGRSSGSYHQQSDKAGAGRIFGEAGRWQKRSDNLRYPVSMTGYGSKSSHRPTISSFRRTKLLLAQRISLKLN